MKKSFIYSFALAAVALLVGVGVVSAHGGLGNFSNLTLEEQATQHEQMFEKQADILGISVDDYKQAWSEGKNLMQIAEEQGITVEDLRSRMQEQKQSLLQEHLNNLVTQGVITQAQADSRLAAMEQQVGKGMGMMGPKGAHHHGFFRQ